MATRSRLCFEGFERIEGAEAMRLGFTAMQLQADLTRVQISQTKRTMDVTTNALPESTLLKVVTSNCCKCWIVKESGPFMEINLNNAASDWTPRARDSTYQQVTALYRFVLQLMTNPPRRIQDYALRLNGKSGRDEQLQSLPHAVEQILIDFGEDALGMGRDELRKGNSVDLVRSTFYQSLGSNNAERSEALEQMTKEREKWRKCLYRSLQKALRDVRAYTYDEGQAKWKPSSAAAELILRQRQRNEFNRAAYEEFVNSETTARVLRFSSEGLTGLTGNALEMRLIANQLQGDILAAKIERVRRETEISSHSEEQPQNAVAISISNLTKNWILNGPPPFVEVFLNNLMLDYRPCGRESGSLFQTFTAVYRYLFKKITYPPYKIQQYSVRVNAKGGRDPSLRDLPGVVETLLIDFVEDLIGYGSANANVGEIYHGRRFYRSKLFKALQAALRDIRASKYDYETIPSDRKAKRGHVSDTETAPAGEASGDENVPPEGD